MIGQTKNQMLIQDQTHDWVMEGQFLHDFASKCRLFQRKIDESDVTKEPSPACFDRNVFMND